MQNHVKCHEICNRGRNWGIIYKCTGGSPRTINYDINGEPTTTKKNKIGQYHRQFFYQQTLKHKWSKAIDMHFYWIKYRCTQGYYNLLWRPGANNLGDYHTKYCSPVHH